MADMLTITAYSRSDSGKGASRRLRRTGMVPGIIYGTGSEPQSIAVKHNELAHQLENEAFYSSILSVEVDGKAEKAVLKDMQRHPSRPFIMHLDLLRVSSKEVIKMSVPLHFTGEETAPGVKEGGTASHLFTEVEVSCLPADLPEYIDVDVSAMDIGDAVHLSEIKLPEGVELPALALGEDHDMSIFTILAPRVEEEPAEEEAATEAAAEGEAAEAAEEGSEES
ncbi:MAG: 50S ribosomal protein L25/general stress protein Ctc [Pseudomonadota bacterium]